MKSYKQKKLEQEEKESELLNIQRFRKDCYAHKGKRKSLDCNIGYARDFSCKNFIKFGFVCNKESCNEEE